MARMRCTGMATGGRLREGARVVALHDGTTWYWRFVDSSTTWAKHLENWLASQTKVRFCQETYLFERTPQTRTTRPFVILHLTLMKPAIQRLSTNQITLVPPSSSASIIN